jgi:hypothetical protein
VPLDLVDGQTIPGVDVESQAELIRLYVKASRQEPPKEAHEMDVGVDKFDVVA